MSTVRLSNLEQKKTKQSRKPLDLVNCTLNPKGRKSLREPLHIIERCYDCSKCGWNKKVIAERMEEYRREQMYGKGE